MIFLTVGTQLPFDRMVRALDQIAPDLDWPVFGQIGKSDYRPRHFNWAETLDPHAFEDKFRAASIIASHAGIGTVLTAQRLGKPIVLFPRQARYGEHRNDHQLATSARLEGRAGIAIARTREDLVRALRTTDARTPTAASERRNAFVANLGQAVAQLVGR